MSISEGLRLGVELSRGARRESRADAAHQAALKQQQEDAAFQARMRPLQEKQATLGLRDIENRIAHGEAMRPLELEGAGLSLAESRASHEHNAKVRPLELAAGQERLEGARTSRKQQEITFKQQQEAYGLEQRRQWVNQQAPLEYARFQRTGQFSDRFLRESMAVGSPIAPLRLVDGQHIDALDTLHDLLDPRRPSNPYDGDKLFEAANLLLAPELNNGGVNPETGAAITDKRIVAVYPAKDRAGKALPGQLYVELEMTDENGQRYRAPATVGRGSGDDEELKTISLDSLVKRVNAQRMFAGALTSDPGAKERLISQGRQLTQKPGDIKSDEVLWQGRPRKFNDVYKVYNDDSSLKTADGAPLVTFEEFEWTSGDPQKLQFLRAAAQENGRIYTEAMQLQRKRPQQAAQLLQEWVDPRELYEMSQQSRGSAAQQHAQSVLDRVDGSQQKPNQADSRKAQQQSAQAEFFQQSDWHLSPELPAFARNEMTPELWASRRQSLQQQSADKNEQINASRNNALQALETEYPQLDERQKRAWILKHGQHLDRETRRRLLAETEPVRG